MGIRPANGGRRCKPSSMVHKRRNTISEHYGALLTTLQRFYSQQQEADHAPRPAALKRRRTTTKSLWRALGGGSVLALSVAMAVYALTPRQLRLFCSARPAHATAPHEEHPPLVAPAVQHRLASAVAASWASIGGSMLLSWQLVLTDAEHPVLKIVHLGAPLGDASREALQQAVATNLGYKLLLHDEALSPSPVTAETAQGVSWLPALEHAFDTLRRVPTLYACVEVPVARAPLRRIVRQVKEAVLDARAQGLADRVVLALADRWSVRLASEPCKTPQLRRSSETRLRANRPG